MAPAATVTSVAATVVIATVVVMAAAVAPAAMATNVVVTSANAVLWDPALVAALAALPAPIVAHVVTLASATAHPTAAGKQTGTANVQHRVGAGVVVWLGWGPCGRPWEVGG